MKAFILDRYGKARRLRFGDMPSPELRDKDVLVQVHAAGVNPLDVKIRDGAFKRILPYRLPLVLGNDVAGIVVAIGPGVRQFKPGDAVFACVFDLGRGALAEFVAVPERVAAPKPDNLDFVQAAAVPMVGLTAWQALKERGRLRPAVAG